MLFIKNGMLIDPDLNLQEVGNLYIKDNKIACVETEKWTEGEIPSTDDIKKGKTIDATGKWVMPGLIDLHVHFRDPGYEYKEDIFSGALSAAKGGFTTVCCMPNTNPIMDCVEVVSKIEGKAKKACGVNILMVGSITKGQKGKELADIEGMASCKTKSTELMGRGICAISEDGRTVMDAAVMLDGIKKGKELGLKVFSHTEDESLQGTKIGEELIVARDIMLAKEADMPIHLCHISTAGSLEIIRKAKEEGIAVTAETGPHYFVFDSTMRGEDGNRKMNPPLRDKEDVEAVRKALKDGTLDAIATDHAPHSKEEKDVPYSEALNGVIGLETSFAVSYTALVKTGIISPIELVDKMSCKPAEILKSSRGTLRIGSFADIAIADVEKSFTVNRESFVSKSVNSPFIGMEIFGEIMYTVVNGEIVYACKK